MLAPGCKSLSKYVHTYVLSGNDGYKIFKIKYFVNTQHVNIHNHIHMLYRYYYLQHIQFT